MGIKLGMLLVFFAVMVGIGLYCRKHATDVSGFVLGGRSVGPWLTAFAYGTSYFSAVVFVGYAGQFGWKYGIAATWAGIGNALLGSLLAWVVLGRRTRIMTQHLDSATMPEFFGKRFGSQKLKVAASVIIFIFLIPYTASLYNGLSRLFGMAFDIDYGVCVVVMAILTGVYVIAGGYMATAINDFIQGIIMIFGICAVIAAVLNSQGGFLAALLAGFVAGYVVEFLKKITEKLPASLNGIRPMLIYPLGGILIVGVVMCGINPIMGMINTAMTNWLNAMGGTSKVLLGAIVAGMMSIDMGGPFNKAAYVFGTAALASGNYEVMAAVMVGGMVPPIAIALSTTFCPKKWTPDERRNGIVNYIMGLCFVTEGAIPYAAADPLRVLPSCVIGAALSGALSMTFGCALRAPHGGIFVFPVVDHAVMYCVALAVGSVVGAVILSLLKKTRTEE